MESFGVDVSGGYRLPRPEALMTEFLLLKPAAPEQLPRDVRGFTGRSAELVRLDALADGAIALLTGPAGIGKTALAVRWGHRAAERFPDGQLFVNLRGFDHVVPPMEPAEALRRLLTALGVPTRRVPAGLDERAALYRAEMADRRALVVLDNAGVATQVRPLLAAARNCVTVVTCRNQLTGLIVREGAQPAEVPPLAPAEAAQLLGHRLGPDRVAGETLAVADMIDRCARLPLALSLAAARAAGRPRPPQPPPPPRPPPRPPPPAARRPGRRDRGADRLRSPARRRASGFRLVVPGVERHRGPALPDARPAPGARPHRDRDRRNGRSHRRSGHRPARRVGPGRPAQRVRTRPLLVPRPPTDVRRRVGFDAADPFVRNGVG
ncbi:hypothetical protein [Paractinoplanes durhamensis]|uniref:hypothetical protein n=1 Tax=Paractinoplanes durhamensis TaxID=113563 RepID=UPI0031D0FE86